MVGFSISSVIVGRVKNRRADADRMLAAGEVYTGTTLRLKRICP
jgi:hypothetical protein